MWRPEYLYLREMRDAISRIVALIDGVQLSADLEDDWVKADALRLIHSIRQRCTDLRRCWSRLAL